MNRKEALREALDLDPADSILETDDPRTFMVETRARGVPGICNGVPADTLHVYLVLKADENELYDEVPASPCATHKQYQIYLL
ncbi:MAG TPA: hypothetical protein ENN11_05595 [Methanomicrobia archaeon]|nr:hypothetical protein [Methanomicrobia archaeon]